MIIFSGFLFSVSAMLLLASSRLSRRSRPVAKRALLILGIAGALLGWLHTCVLHDIRYDMRMYTAIKAFDAFEPAPRSARSETEAQFGLIFGNSNHCDYFIGALIRSTLPLEQLRKHYSGLSIPSPLKPGKLDHPGVEIWKEEYPYMHVPFMLRESKDWRGLSPDAPRFSKVPNAPVGRLYLLSVWDVGHAPNDLRCH